MTSQLLLLSVDLATMLMLALFATRVLSVHPQRQESWLILLLCAAAIAHVALSRAEYGPWMPEAYRFSFGAGAPVLNVIRNLAPGLFALLTYVVFTDRRRRPFGLYVALGVQAVLETLRIREVTSADALSAWLQIAFAAVAIYWTIGYWRADLIESRRRSRAIVAIILGINVVASTILLRLVIAENSIANYHGHIVLSVATLLLILFLLLRLMNGEIALLTSNNADAVAVDRDAGVAATVTVPIAPRVQERIAKSRADADDVRRNEDEIALQRLNSLLHEQHIHWEAALSLKQLAGRVGLPEYRMRQLIHEQLGFRNFNAFLHNYRIQDAIGQLADPTQLDKSILAIAQSVGYDSVNTFNRGFKEVTNVTPSQYRENSRTSMDTRPACASGSSSP